MIGIVAVSHNSIAKELVATTKRILPDTEGLVAVSIEENSSVETNRQKIADAISSLGSLEGVLLLSDMFGGTPSNLCLSFLGRPNLEVISGMNLPMLIKLAGDRKNHVFNELVTFIRDYGRKNILIASSVLEGKIDQ